MINIKEYIHCSLGCRHKILTKYDGKVLFEQLYYYRSRINHSIRIAKGNEQYRCEGISIDYDGEKFKKIGKKLRMNDCHSYIKIIKQLS